MLKETFISKAVAVHGDKYDYSQVCDTINTHGKVTIVCRKHGAFEQEANSHMRGRGCEECSYEERGMRHRAQGFIERAKLVHGDRYDYSKTVYELANKKVTIICPVHGEFEQIAGHHMRGCGCPHCKRSLGEERIAKFLDSRNIKFTPQYKLIIDNLFVADKILRVDFFLPEYKTFIEFNGLQHYQPVDLFGGEERLISQQERDYALRLYCKEKKIHLLEIPYNEFGNIEGILKRSLRI